MAALIALTGAPASAPAASSKTALGDSVAELSALQSLDARVADVAWRIVSRAVDLCPLRRPALGLALHDLSQYTPASRDAARAAFGLSETRPAVLSVAQGSPAKFAGIQPNDVILAVNGRDFMSDVESDSVSRGGSARYERVDRATAALEALPEGVASHLTLLRSGETITVSLTPQTVCRSRVELVPEAAVSGNANGHVAQISGALAVWVQSEDELALAIAHEVAHNVLGHQARINREGLRGGLVLGLGGKARMRRDLEREADRLGTWMAARAGFNYRLAPAFMERVTRQAGIGALWATTHPTPANRRRHLEGVVAEITASEAGRVAPQD